MSATAEIIQAPDWLSPDGAVDFEAALSTIATMTDGGSAAEGPLGMSPFLRPILSQRFAAGLQVFKVEASVVDVRTGKLLRHGEVHVCGHTTEHLTSSREIPPGEPFADVVLTLKDENGSIKVDYSLMVSSEPGPHGLPTLSCHRNVAVLAESRSDGTWTYRSADAHPAVGIDIVAVKVHR